MSAMEVECDGQTMDAMVQNLKNELFVKQIWAGEHMFGLSGWQCGQPQPDSPHERFRRITYWVCCAHTTENAPDGPNYRTNLDWMHMHLKDRIENANKYMDAHPEHRVHPLNLLAPAPDNRSVFHRAVEAAAPETLQLLLTHHAERTQPDINVKTKDMTPFGLLLRLGLDTPKQVACFWVLVEHMLARNVCDNSCPIPLFAFRAMKDDPAKFASFRETVARKSAEWKAAQQQQQG
jgi:hypothetical protein